jgi:dienelactone hydrolase
MRPLEIVMAVALLAYVLHLLSPTRNDGWWFGLLPFIVALLTIYHVAEEGYRWQMFPAYCLVIVFVVCECMRWLFPFNLPDFAIYFFGAIAFVFLSAAIVFSTAQPVFNLPALSGPYKVGTQIRYVVDESRDDPFSDYRHDARELMIQIWYPADPSARGSVAPYRDRRITTLRDGRYALVKTHSILGTELSHSHTQYPLLLYSHSWSGLRTESTFLCEELASHGYVVVGIDHPYGAAITVFPDGRIARRNFEGQEDYTSPAALEAFVRTADQQVGIRSLDAISVLNTLERLNADDPLGLLTGRLDVARVGIFGWSFGGTTAAEAASLDRRFKAGADIAGMIAGNAAKQGTFSPFLFMYEGAYEHPPYAPGSDQTGLDPEKRREVEFNRDELVKKKQSLSRYGGYLMVVAGTDHPDFSDAPISSPLRYTHAEDTARIVSRFTLAFFDKYLKGIEQPLLDGPSPSIPGVSLHAWNRPS